MQQPCVIKLHVVTLKPLMSIPHVHSKSDRKLTCERVYTLYMKGKKMSDSVFVVVEIKSVYF